MLGRDDELSFALWPRSRVDVGARESTVSVPRLRQLVFARAAVRTAVLARCQLIMVHECVTRCVERCVDARWPIRAAGGLELFLAACKTLAFASDYRPRRWLREDVPGVQWRAGARRTGSTTESSRERCTTQGRACRATRLSRRARSRPSPAAARRRRARPGPERCPVARGCQSLPHPWAREGK